MPSSPSIKPTSLEDVQAILRGTTIPSPPQIVVDLQMEMAMPDPDLGAMSKLIAEDAGLSGGVLKTVNSAIYGGGEPVVSVSKAILLLGMNTILNIINTLCLRNEMMNMDNVPDHLFKAMNSFWDSAAEVAHCCVMVAQRIRYPRPDHAYALGLFHNVGVPLLMLKYEHYAEVMCAAYEKPSPRIVDAENSQLKTNHAVIGFFVARAWKLPESLTKLISLHHNTEIFFDPKIPDTDENQLLAILKIAEHIAGLYRVLGGQPNNPEWNKAGPKILEFVGLSGFDLDELISEAREKGLGELPYNGS